MYIFMFLPFIYIQRKIDVLAKTTIIASTHVNILWTRRSLFISLKGSSFFMFFIDLIVEIVHTIQIPAATNLVIWIYFIFLTFLLFCVQIDWYSARSSWFISFTKSRGGYVVLTYLRIFLYTVWGLYSFGRSINPSAACLLVSVYHFHLALMLQFYDTKQQMSILLLQQTSIFILITFVLCDTMGS